MNFKSYDYDDFKLIEKISTSSFKNIYKIQKIDSNEFLSAHRLKVNDESQPNANLIKLLNIMIRLNHPSIIKFIGFSPTFFHKTEKPTIFTEFLPENKLINFIEAEKNHFPHKSWNETKKLINLYGIASAISYLHANNIVHLDITPYNIFIDSNFFPKVINFSLSEFIKHDKKLTEFKGTPRYVAPEIWRNYDYSFASDTYSYGITIYEIISGKTVYDNMNVAQILAKVASNKRPEIDKKVPESYQRLIEKCWSDEPSKRPTFDQILEILTTDRGFITNKVNEKEFFDYINLIKNSIPTKLFDKDIEFSFDEYLDQDKVFIKEDTKEEDENAKNSFDTEKVQKESHQKVPEPKKVQHHETETKSDQNDAKLPETKSDKKDIESIETDQNNAESPDSNDKKGSSKCCLLL